MKRFKLVVSNTASKGEQELIFKFGEDRFHSVRLPPGIQAARIAALLQQLAENIRHDEELK